MPFPEVPFAEVSDLEARWKLLTPGERATAAVLLEDASQLIIDVCPRASEASVNTLRRVACAVVKRAMTTPSVAGASSVQQGGGGYQASVSFANPHGDLYLSKSEKQSLGCGRQRAFTIDLLPQEGVCCGGSAP